MSTATTATIPAIDTTARAIGANFGGVRMLTAHRAGFRAVCISPPAGGNWASNDRAQMRSACEVLGIREGIVPNLRPGFSGRVAQRGELWTLRWELDEKHSLRRFANPCEGGWVDIAGQALVVPFAGCMLIAATATGGDGMLRLATSHAGFRSLADVDKLTGRPERQFESVVYSIASAFKERCNIDSHDVAIECFFGLAPGALVYHYDNENSELHKKFLDYLVGRWGEKVAYETEDAKGKGVVVDPGALFLAQAGPLFKSATRWCDIHTDGPYANTRHTDPSLSGSRRNLGVIIRTR